MRMIKSGRTPLPRMDDVVQIANDDLSDLARMGVMPANESDDAARTVLRLHCGQRHPGEPMTDSDNIRILRELIAELDRRLPQMHDAGEASIAREAAALKVSALERVATLEYKVRSA